MTLLALETSCDETSAAVVRDGCVLSNVVASQTRLHETYGGVVPELATREHLKNLQPVTCTALREAGIQAEDLDAIAATQGPGLPAALMVGLKAAQSMAFVLAKPFIGINHHEAHLYSPWIWGTPPREHFDVFEPNVSLIVSGGHTLLLHVPAEFQHRILGGTIDDAAGECFDKTAKLIGLPYPGGPQMDRLAQGGNARRFDFPRPKMRDADDDFSFSGLKTAVRYFLRDHPEIGSDAPSVRDLCASVQLAIVEVLVTKTLRAAERQGVRCITASGGVTANRSLRAELSRAAASREMQVRIAEPIFSTDNAAMIAIVAERKLRRGLESPLDIDIAPGLTLG